MPPFPPVRAPGVAYVPAKALILRRVARTRMEAAFQLLASPRFVDLPGFRFAHHRVRGPYAPWARVATHDAVAEALERAEIDRIGPPFGVYYDLPFPLEDAERWTADLGHPVAPETRVPRLPGMRVTDVPPMPVGGLRYRGDLASFEPALELLLDWLIDHDVEPEGPLMERFHVSDPLTGVEERDIYVALRPLRL